MVERVPRLLLWAQHLLGIGHAQRAAALARACAQAGWSVDLAMGGLPVPSLDTGRARLHQLPPLAAADAAFSGLVDAAGRPADDAVRAARRAALLDLFDAVQPDVLVTEHYPFGRRQLRFELEPLLARAAAHAPPPLVVASVRDILVARRPTREAETVDLVRHSYDHVLVHGDPALVDLGASFAPAAAIADRTVYTGYVSGLPVPARERAGGMVLVSAGGGAVGRALAEAALAAAGARPERAWRVLVGHGTPDTLFARFRAAAPSNTTIERARPDFRDLMAGAAVSVSQAGYNTVVDLLVTETPAVLVPFAAGNETEQSLRAARLAAQGRAVVVAESALDPARLNAAVDRALTLRPRGPTPRLNGETETERLLRRWIDERAPARRHGTTHPDA